MRSLSTVYRQWLAAVVCGLVATAGISTARADDADPPGRVARLSLAEGSVSLQPAGVNDWTNATVNRPLTTGDKIWADRDSRAELDLGIAAIRMGSTTGFSFLNLDDHTAQMNVTAGTVIVHVREAGQDQTFEVDTPNVAVTLLGPGDYRVEVNDAGDATVVKVSDGDAEVAATGQTVPVHTQQAYLFSGTNQVTADRASLGAPDSLDSWSLDRDRREQQAAQQNDYVDPEVAGASELNDYGNWESTPEYGAVWTPTDVPEDWAPYQYGRWVWVSPWDGRGWMRRRGVLRHSTMVGGPIWVRTGAGCPARGACTRSTRPRWSRGSGHRVLPLRSAVRPRWPGLHSARVKCTCPRTTSAKPTCGT